MGAKIGPFEIVRSLGKGGMGEVFLVKDPSCERMIALKKIREDLLKHKSMHKRFLREAKIAARLTHPSIIPIYTISDDTKSAYYTMPYIEGETLKQILLATAHAEKEGERHPLGSSIPALMRIFLNICQAIAYVHAKGILHRDLKADNIIVGKYGEVMIVDWGLASYMSEPENHVHVEETGENLTHPGKVAGTLSHLAPERANGDQPSFLTDIYALGVMLYQLLTLRLPFQRNNLEEFRKRAGREEYLAPQEIAPYRDIPEQLAQMAKKCLAPKNARYQSVQELLRDLQNYSEGRPEWNLSATLDIEKKEDWEFQENILLAKHLAITRTPEVLEWVNLMISAASYPGNIKIETRVSLGPEGKGIGILLAIPEAAERIGFADGYSIWVSSASEPFSKLFRSNVEVMAFPDTTLSPGTCHTICIEKLDNHLYFTLDGALKCHYISHRPLVGTHVGLLSRDRDFQMEPLKISVGSQSVQVNCLAVPDAFLASRHFGKALHEYRRIGYSFPGRAEGREALFRAGITLLEEALVEKKKSRKHQLFSLALEEFGKLRSTPGAPLEYLGKSLVYKAWHETEDEVKCLELALRKYPKHPLLPILREEISFRLHESSTQDRVAGYLFALLALRHLPQIFSSQDNQKLLESLKKSLEPLAFLEPGEHLIDLSIHLAFLLAKPIVLMEIYENTHDNSVKQNALFALLHLGCFQLVKELIPEPDPLFGTALLAEKKIAAALKQLPTDPRLLAFLCQRAHDSGKSSLLLPHLDQLSQEERIRTLLFTSQREEAKKEFKTPPPPSSPLFPLYACTLRATGGEAAANAYLQTADEGNFSHTFLSHFLAKKLELAQLFHSEKMELLRDLVLYAHCGGSDEEKAWQAKLKKEAGVVARLEKI